MPSIGPKTSTAIFLGMVTIAIGAHFASLHRFSQPYDELEDHWRELPSELSRPISELDPSISYIPGELSYSIRYPDEPNRTFTLYAVNDSPRPKSLPRSFFEPYLLVEVRDSDGHWIAPSEYNPGRVDFTLHENFYMRSGQYTTTPVYFDQELPEGEVRIIVTLGIPVVASKLVGQ